MTEPAPEVRLSAYVLPHRVLAIVLNQGPEAARAFRYDLTPWIPVQSEVQMTRTTEATEHGANTPAEAVSPTGTLTTPKLKRLERVVYEFLPLCFGQRNPNSLRAALPTGSRPNSTPAWPRFGVQASARLWRFHINGQSGLKRGIASGEALLKVPGW